MAKGKKPEYVVAVRVDGKAVFFSFPSPASADAFMRDAARMGLSAAKTVLK